MASLDRRGDAVAPIHELGAPEVRNDLFSSPRWWGVLRRTYGFEVTECVAPIGSGRTAWVDLDDPAGPRRVSLPFCDLVDLPADDAAWQQLRTHYLGPSPARLTTRADHPVVGDPAFVSSVTAVHQIVPVAPEGDLRAGFSTLPKRMSRKAERTGIRFRVATDLATLRTFHEMHLEVRRRRHGLLAQPFEFFEEIHASYLARGDGGVVVGEVDGEIVGGCVLLHTDGVVHYKFAATRPEHRPNGVSHGAVLAALEHTRDLGADRLDFGRSDLDQPGLVDFKRRFGAISNPIALSTRGDLARPDFRALLSELTDLYVRPDMPAHLAAAAGDRLYRYFA